MSVMTAATHVAPLTAIVIGLFAAAGLSWAWIRLDQGVMPRTQVRLRRLTLSTGAIAVIGLVCGLGFVDPTRNPRGYIIIWSAIMLTVVIAVTLAVIDAVVSASILRRAHEAIIAEQATRLSATITEEELDKANADIESDIDIDNTGDAYGSQRS